MRVVDAATPAPAVLRGGVAAIGNFDGVHRGHRAVIAQASALARARTRPLVVVTFEPHPRRFFHPQDPPFRLTTPPTKFRLLRELGVDGVFVLPFDGRLARTDATAFLHDILMQRLGIGAVVVGENFRFGAGRVGTLALMRRQDGLETHTAAPTLVAGAICSSSRIRNCVQRGAVAEAMLLLDRPFEIVGDIIPGAQQGRRLGVPTANIDLGAHLHPRYGVYAARVAIGDDDSNDQPPWRAAAVNIGTRPTVAGGRTLLEAHLLDFDGDLYHQPARVALLDFIRPEQHFSGLDALKAQIDADIVAVWHRLRSNAAGSVP